MYIKVLFHFTLNTLILKESKIFKKWNNIRYRVPQGSIFGSLLLNIYIDDLFLVDDTCNIISYADDNSPFAWENYIEEVIKTLAENTKYILQWVKK